MTAYGCWAVSSMNAMYLQRVDGWGQEISVLGGGGQGGVRLVRYVLRNAMYLRVEVGMWGSRCESAWEGGLKGHCSSLASGGRREAWWAPRGKALARHTGSSGRQRRRLFQVGSKLTPGRQGAAPHLDARPAWPLGPAADGRWVGLLGAGGKGKGDAASEWGQRNAKAAGGRAWVVMEFRQGDQDNQLIPKPPPKPTLNQSSSSLSAVAPASSRS